MKVDSIWKFDALFIQIRAWLGPFLFINNFHKGAEFFMVHNSADDTSTLLTENSLKKLNKHISGDLKLSLNTIKTNQEIERLQNILNCCIIEPNIVSVDSVKYLGLTLQSDLCWKTHLTSLEKKLSRSICLLLKVRHCAHKFLLRTIYLLYYSIFNSHLIYDCKVWGQNQNNVPVQRLQKLQEKAVCWISFETNPNGAVQLFKSSNILNLTDFVKYKYPLFIIDLLRKENIAIFNEVCTIFNQNHVYNTSGSTNQMLVVPHAQITYMGNIHFKIKINQCMGFEIKKLENI